MDTDSGAQMPDTPDTDITGAGEPTQTTNNASYDAHVAILNKENRKFRQEAAFLKGELDKIRAAHASDTEQAIAKARAEGEAVYKDRYRGKALENAAQARLMARGVKELELALKALDLSKVEFDLESDRVDEDALVAVIDATLKKHPVLSAVTPDENNGNAPQGFGNQRRVTSEELLKAKDDKVNEMLRFALGGRSS